jgi:hypothetical protein
MAFAKVEQFLPQAEGKKVIFLTKRQFSQNKNGLDN